MSFYEITGGRPLEGRLAVQGSKNSVLPILAAAILIPGESVIHNCPHLSDVDNTLDILRLLGCQVLRDGTTVRINASHLTRWDIPDRLVREMRGSVVFLGSLLARLGAAQLCYPGGCELGPRPIDLHLSALRALGAEIAEEHGLLHCMGCRPLQGREICLSIPSVGATENAMLAACGCQGKTVITGAAREPEIVDLQDFLRKTGVHITGAGTSRICIQGGVSQDRVEHTVIGDRMAGATYLCAAAAAGGSIELTGLEPEHLACVLAVLEEAGCRITQEKGQVTLHSSGQLHGVRPVRTAPYPGFPTDAQAVLMAALAGGEGSTMFVENIFDSRYHHVDELRRMGARIQTDGRVAVVTGAGRLHGADVHGTDLRGAAALVVAALGAKGVSRVSGLAHLERGYDSFGDTLSSLGARIQTL